MTTPWGPAFEAEIAYRQQQVRAQVANTRREPRRADFRWARGRRGEHPVA